MPDTEQEQTSGTEQEKGGDSGGGSGRAGTALKAAAAAAATGAAATFAVRKAMSHGSNGSGDGDDGGEGVGDKVSKSPKKAAEAGQSLFASAAAGGMDAARDALLPLAEDAADAAGRYLAESGPDFVKDRIVPRFIESFNKAKG